MMYHCRCSISREVFHWQLEVARVSFNAYPVGIKINYHLQTSIYVTSILSYTVLEDDANDEK